MPDGPETMDTTNNDGGSRSVPAVPLQYSNKRSLEDRVAALERHWRLMIVATAIMTMLAVTFGCILAYRLYEVR